MPQTQFPRIVSVLVYSQFSETRYVNLQGEGFVKFVEGLEKEGFTFKRYVGGRVVAFKHGLNEYHYTEPNHDA